MVLGALGGIFMGGLFQEGVMFWQGLFLGMWVGCLLGLWLILMILSYNLIAAFFGGITIDLKDTVKEQVELEHTLILNRQAGSRQ